MNLLVEVIGDLEKSSFSGIVRTKALLEQAQKREEKDIRRTNRSNLSFAVGGSVEMGQCLEGYGGIKGGFSFI